LEPLVKTLDGSARKVQRAQILLKACERLGGWTDLEISEAYSCRTKTVENIRFRFGESGFKLTLNGKPPAMPPRARTFDGQGEAPVIALRISEPPKGYANWTLDLLQERVAALSIVDSVSRETLRQTLKNRMTQRKIQYWVIPPKQNAQLAADMENVLQTYLPP